jgi:hypothetical protein
MVAARLSAMLPPISSAAMAGAAKVNCSTKPSMVPMATSPMIAR